MLLRVSVIIYGLKCLPLRDEFVVLPPSMQAGLSRNHAFKAIND